MGFFTGYSAKVLKQLNARDERGEASLGQLRSQAQKELAARVDAAAARTTRRSTKRRAKPRR